jgi:hypothetical protein
MTGSISYRLVDLVWINRMKNKWNEMKMDFEVKKMNFLLQE